LKSLATGIEETAALALLTPPGGPPLLSAVGDIGGFYHKNLDTAPTQAFHTPTYGTTDDLDYAGNKPSNIVRTGSSTTDIQIALSTDFGVTWNPYYGGTTTTQPGKVAISADADTVLLMSSGAGALVSRYTAAFSAVSTLPSGAAIASDKRNNSMFYGGSGGRYGPPACV
jgi:xyloglucan-specific exo-beta-1,4-glucanase